MNFNELYKICVTEEKRKTDKLIPWLNYIIRPLSILVSKPLLKTNVNPITITAVSMLTSVVGFVFVSFGCTQLIKIIGWMGFFIWALLDCVDGNVARFKGLASDRGALWDATGGYLALSLIFFAAGIGAYHDDNIVEFSDRYLYIIYGGMASLMSLFPRLVMQKKKTAESGRESALAVTDKKRFGLSKIIALNIESAIGLMQIVLLLAIIFHFMNIFALFYMVFNFLMMIYSLYLLLK